MATYLVTVREIVEQETEFVIEACDDMHAKDAIQTAGYDSIKGTTPIGILSQQVVALKELN